MALPFFTVYYDADKNAKINSDGTTTSVITPSIFCNNTYIMRIQMYNIYPTVYDLSGITTWTNLIGNLGSTATPLITTNNDDINSDAWANATLGKITVKIDTSSATFIADIGTKPMKTFYSELRGNDGSYNITNALFSVYGKSTVYNI